ncbi:MAG: dihydroneopterin aldolase [Flavobacteriaceae bacterium]
MDTVVVKNIRCYAYHGCLEEEAIIGSDYLVNIAVVADLSTSCKSDALSDTVDYVSLHRIVRAQMVQRANLLEAVSDRIICAIFDQHPEVEYAEVEVTKCNPPIDGDVEAVAVRLKRSRSA